MFQDTTESIFIIYDFTVNKKGFFRMNEDSFEEIGNQKEYPVKEETDAEQYISDLVDNYSVRQLKRIDTDWYFDSLSKEKLEKFKEGYEKVHKKEVEGNLEKSNFLKYNAVNCFSAGIIIGGIAGYLSGDFGEGVKNGGLMGSFFGTVVATYSVVLDSKSLDYKNKLDVVYEKFFDEPKKKLYGIK